MRKFRFIRETETMQDRLWKIIKELEGKKGYATFGAVSKIYSERFPEDDSTLLEAILTDWKNYGIQKWTRTA